MTKYQYWICVCIGHFWEAEDENANNFLHLGALQKTKFGEKPKKFTKQEVWKEISEYDYEEALRNDNHVINYDGVHCIGQCNECIKYIGRFLPTGRYIRCDQEKPLYSDMTFEDETCFHACCIIKEQQPKEQEVLKNTNKKFSLRQIFEKYILFLFRK